MTRAIQVPLHSQEVRGVDASVLYGLSEDSRTRLVELLDRGHSVEDALRILANTVSDRAERLNKGVKRVNPFGSS